MTQTEKNELQVTEKKTLEPTGGEPTREGIWYLPQADIIEDAETITLYADLPGVTKDHLTIDVREGILTLTGSVAPIDKRFTNLYREYEPGGFTRRFTLGEKIDQDKISAKLDNGVLTLTLPKAEAAKPRKIKVG
jgi:HSP20 family protein